MSLLNQKTIRENINFSGVALHSGKIVSVSIKPSEPNSGIVFKRVDLNENNLIFPNEAILNGDLTTTSSY